MSILAVGWGQASGWNAQRWSGEAAFALALGAPEPRSLQKYTTGEYTLINTASTSDRNVARIFNSFIASAAMAAAWETGALDELMNDDRLDVVEFARLHNLDVEATRGMFTALASVQITDVRDNKVTRSHNFDEAFRAKSFFHWLVRGSSDLFTRMPELMRNAERVGDFYQRDAAAISVACRDINAAFFDPVFWNAMSAVNFTKVADLGCGSGERLMQILRHFPEAQGIGIDIADGALQVATTASEKADLTERVTFVKADVCHLEDRPEFEDVNLLTCFLMGHDFWPLDNCVATLQRIRETFPNVKKLLLGDTARTVAIPAPDLPVFTLGFEVGHALMGAYLPTLDEWKIAIEKSGWACAKRHLIDTPADTVIFELEPR